MGVFLWLFLAGLFARADFDCAKHADALLSPPADARLAHFEARLALLRERVKDAKAADRQRGPREQRNVAEEAAVRAANEELLAAAAQVLRRHGVRTEAFTLRGRHRALAIKATKQGPLSRVARGIYRRFGYQLIYDPLTNQVKGWEAYEQASRRAICISDDVIREGSVMQVLRHEFRHAFLSFLRFGRAEPAKEEELPLLSWIEAEEGKLGVPGYREEARLDEWATHVADLFDFSAPLRRIHAQRQRAEVAFAAHERELAAELKAREEILDRARADRPGALSDRERDTGLERRGDEIERRREERARDLAGLRVLRQNLAAAYPAEHMGGEAASTLVRLEALGQEVEAVARALKAGFPGVRAGWSFRYNPAAPRGARVTLERSGPNGVRFTLQARPRAGQIEVSAKARGLRGLRRALEFSFLDPRLFAALRDEMRIMEAEGARRVAEASEGYEPRDIVVSVVDGRMPLVGALRSALLTRLELYLRLAETAATRGAALRAAFAEDRTDDYLSDLRELRRTLWAAYRLPPAGGPAAPRD